MKNRRDEGSETYETHEINARDFQRRFGAARRRALQSPLVVMNHGRRDLVVMSAELYDSLGLPVPVRAEDLSEADVRALEEPFEGHGGEEGLDAHALHDLLDREESEGCDDEKSSDDAAA